MSLPRQYLAEMDEFDVKMGPWALGKGRLNGEKPITVKGKSSPMGLSVHPPSDGFSSVKYHLDKTAKIFKTGVAINDESPGAKTPITFAVFGDGKPLWSSRPITKTRDVQFCSTSVVGINVLELRAICPGDHVDAHAVWVEPLVTR